MNDETRLTPGDDTRLVTGDDTRLTPGDDTRLVADDQTRITAGDETRLGGSDQTVHIEEATVLLSGVVDDLSQVHVTLRPKTESSEGSSPTALVPGGESFSLHRPIAVGRRPVTPLAPTERILLLTWDPADTQVSATHLLLEPTDRGVAVTDLGSSNGTRVLQRGRHPQRLGPRESCLVTGEATVEFGRDGKIVLVPAVG